jgi:hypothetical protein
MSTTQSEIAAKHGFAVENAMEVLELAKAFAGPVATIIAAGTAAWITYRLGRSQVRIAETQALTAASQKDIAKSQRDIAYDRLKYDLFEKRYEIYLAAKKLIEYTGQLKKPGDVLDQSAQELKVKLLEARFFFPPTEAALFANIAQLAAIHHIASVTPFAPDGSPQAEVEKIYTDSIMQLVQIYEKLPELLEKELGFAQLTSRG